MSEPSISDQPTSQSVEDGPQPLFKPPTGGDLVLRSSDGLEFQVHSHILKQASSVFDGMMIAGTTQDIVELSEDAATLSLILTFIYPNEKPPMTSGDMLWDFLSVAQKYDLQSVIEYLDEQTALNILQPGPISADPIRTYQLAVQFSLPRLKVAAAQIIAISQLNFHDPQLAPKYPPSILFRLIALQSARARVLSDVLFGFNKLPIHSYVYSYLSCDTCRETYAFELPDNIDREARATLHRNVPNSWVLAWVQLTYQTLLSTALEDSGSIFEVNVLTRFEGAQDVCGTCLDAFRELEPRRFRFNNWAGGVKAVLRRRLKELELLYSL